MSSPQRAPGGFPVVGIIGGGQLARMCAGPAAELAVTLSILAEAPDAAAAQVVPSAPVGDHRDVEAVRAFARECDVVTFDHEHVPADVLAALEADGVVMHPTPAALVFAQDKLAMRRRLTEIDVACPAWAQARTATDVEDFAVQVGWPIVAKTPRGGYDGKGVRVVSGVEELQDWLDQAALDAANGGPLAEGVLLEEKVDFTRELAVLVARSPSDQAAAWPVVETVQTDGICTQVLASPARPGRRHRRVEVPLRPRRLRGALRSDVRTALAATGATAVLVTHDQDEALSMADTVAVMDDGVVRMHATPEQVYTGPVDLGVARFVGQLVELRAQLEGTWAHTVLGDVTALPGNRQAAPAGAGGVLALRPEQLRLHPGEQGQGTPGQVESVSFHGHDATVAVVLDRPGPDARLLVRTTGPTASAGDRVRVTVEGPGLFFPDPA